MRKGSCKHTLESCKASALRFTRPGDWIRSDQMSYRAARNNGWYAECCAHMADEHYHKWSKEECAAEAAKYSHANAFKHGSFKAYRAAHNNGWYAEITQHFVKRYPTAEAGAKRFIERAKLIHGDRYDYSKVIYTNKETKVEIVCPEHGSFMQSPGKHLHDECGCPTCGRASVGLSNRTDLDNFLRNARAIHGDRYDYSRATYQTALDPVEVVCREHGPFLVTPSNHTHISRQQGCPGCAALLFGVSDNDTIYIWRAVGQYFNGNPVFKIGVTSRRLGFDRIEKVARKWGFEFDVVCCEFVNGRATDIEKILHTLGDDPKFVGVDGWSEFRAFDEDTLRAALLIVKSNATVPHD